MPTASCATLTRRLGVRASLMAHLTSKQRRQKRICISTAGCGRCTARCFGKRANNPRRSFAYRDEPVENNSRFSACKLPLEASLILRKIQPTLHIHRFPPFSYELVGRSAANSPPRISRCTLIERVNTSSFRVC